MMLRSRRLSLVTRVFPSLFCRSISMNRVAEKSSFPLSSSESSSAGESCSEAEDGEVYPQALQIRVLRAYVRNRRARCVGRVREQGLVPAVVVDPDRERRPKDGSTDIFIALDAKPLVAILKLIGKRDFVSRVFDMDIYQSPSSSEIKESLQVLPRNLNYGPGKTNILNVQFFRAPPGQDLKLGVPLEFLGIDQCPGLKKGGTLKKIAKYVVYCCKATELPAKIVVDMTVLEIGDRVRVQDLEVDFNHLASDRTMVVCEIVKDVRTLKAKARQLKNELLYKKRALAEKESSSQEKKSSSQGLSLSDDEVEAIDDSEDEVIPYRYQKQRAAAKKGASIKNATMETVFARSDAETSNHSGIGLKLANARSSTGLKSRKDAKPSKRRLTGTPFDSSREKKLDEKAEHHNVLSGMKRQKVFTVSESDDDGALSTLARKQGSTKNRTIGERSAVRGQREQHSISSSLKSLKRCKISDDSEAKSEDGVFPSCSRKRGAHKAFQGRADSNFDTDDDLYKSPSRSRKRAAHIALQGRADSNIDTDDDSYKSPTMQASASRRGYRVRA